MENVRVSYIQTGYQAGKHPTESSLQDVHLFSEFLDEAPVWADRVLFQQETYPRGAGKPAVLRFIAQFDRNPYDPQEWDRFQESSREAVLS